MVTRPSVPPDEFVPDPAAVPALWGLGVKTNGMIIVDQALDLDDVEIAGVQPVPWAVEEGSGVRWVQVVDWRGRTLAVARAVPLS